ncbi:MAG: ATP-binding protein [Spirochaetes bacterium]|nr:ATP-binding protein [Spirochaetota bacterium]
MKKKLPKYLFFFIHLLVLDLLYTSGIVNYLFLHSMIEGVAIVVSASLCIIGWETFSIAKNSRFLFLAVGYLGVALLDTLHTLAYKGMGVFPGSSANLPTQLWMAARYMEAITFLAFCFSIGKNFSFPRAQIFWGMYGWVILNLLLILTGFFPDCFLEETGLTPFKIASEYVVSGLFLLCVWIIIRQRSVQSKPQVILLTSALILKILSEMSFTLYTDVYGFMNYLGHVFKFFSVLLVYDALIEQTLQNPFQSLFIEIEQKNEALEREVFEKEEKRRLLEQENAQKEQLLREVHHRIKNNLASIMGLLQLKLETTLSQETQLVLQETIGRLQTMATLYTKLLVSTEHEHVDGKEYLETLLDAFRKLYTGFPRVRIEQQIQPFRMDPKRLFLVGVVLNELVTNAYKYAFEGKDSGTIEVRLEHSEGWGHLFIQDDGVGITLEKRRGSTGYGLKLVEMLSSQLKGWCALQSDQGTQWEIAFPL